MPTTYNGIGTHYYGRKNAETRVGVCQQCGHSGTLTSYDTRLWFVVVFIPVIPLGRKRIIDECPSCRRHFVMELDKWETAKQLEISGALDEYRTHPTAEAAIAAHTALIHYHQYAQAAEFRQMMQQKFPAQAKVHAYLGAVLEHLGCLNDAVASYQRAYELRPDLPEARVGVAEGHIRAGRLDEARQLLDFLEKPGAAQLYSLAPLESLALACQQANRHDDALALFKVLLEALPALKEHTGFRRQVAKSEKAAGRKESVLPKRKFSWSRLFKRDQTAPAGGTVVTWRGLIIFGAAVTVFIVVMMIGNEYIRRHRPLYLVNALGAPAQVEIPGVGKVMAPAGHTELRLPEGRHRAVITGPVREEHEFVMRADYFDRWFDKPVWVLNVGGAGLLVLRTATYSAQRNPPSLDFRFGSTFDHFPSITHPFQPLPDSLRMKKYESRTLTQLELVREEPSAVSQHLRGTGRLDEALRLAEWRLRRQPGDESMLDFYMVEIASQRQNKRAETFLRTGLTNRPVQIEWHRMYQGIHPGRRHNAQLAGEYDDMLAAEPTNSALLYLRGRVTDVPGEGRKWFERAKEANPQNPYPYYALGYDALAAGDWAGAKELFARAVALKPRDDGFRYHLSVARQGLGEFAALEDEARRELQKDPVSFPTVQRLIGAQVAQRKTNEARQTLQNFERAVATRHGTLAQEYINALRYRTLYALGDFAALEKAARVDASPAGTLFRFEALVEQDRLNEAVQLHKKSLTMIRDPFTTLTLAIAWQKNGDAPESSQWLKRARGEFSGDDSEAPDLGLLLSRATPPTTAEVEALVLPPRAKAISLTALSQIHPAARSELAAAARRMNIELDFPHHLLDRATSAP